MWKVLGLAVCVSVPACGGDEIERPRFLSGEVPIEYPLQMWDQDMEGETVLTVRVSATGAVDSVRVLESSGHWAFDSAAVEGARHLRFRPLVRVISRLRYGRMYLFGSPKAHDRTV